MEMDLQAFHCTFSFSRSKYSFADDKYLVLSLDSSSETSSQPVPDCYQIITSKDERKVKLKPVTNDPIAPGSVANFAIAVSQPYFTVGLLNKAGDHIGNVI